MDNGHTSTKDEQTFFTDGAGSNNVEVNNVNPGDNLDLNSNNNGAASWDMTPGRNLQSTGKSVVNTMFEPINSLNNSQETVLGKVTDTETLEAPHNETNNSVSVHQNSQNISIVDQPANDAFNYGDFRVEKDSISHKTLEATEHIVKQFENGKINPAELEDKKNEAMKAYLSNSFGRKVGE